MNVYEKIRAVMAEVQYLTKDDSVEFKTTKYKAISEEKVTSTVRPFLIKYGLTITPVKMHRERIGTITSVDVTYRITNVDDPNDYTEVVSSGDGADTQDKGAGKAMTYAYKYMILRTFAIPTGEDPDKISSAELDARAEQEKASGDIKKLENATKKLVLKLNGGDKDAAASFWVDNIGKDAGDYEKLKFHYDSIKKQVERLGL